MVPIPLEQTWRSRFMGERRVLYLSTHYVQAMTVSRALPQLYQTGWPPELIDFVPRVVGRYPVGAQLVRQARMLAPRQAPSEAAPALSIANRVQHTTTRMTVTTEETPVLPFDAWRLHIMLINDGPTNDILVAWGGEDAANGVRLVPNGGFIEFALGSVSEIRAVAVGGSSQLNIVEGLAYPYPGNMSARSTRRAIDMLAGRA